MYEVEFDTGQQFFKNFGICGDIYFYFNKM